MSALQILNALSHIDACLRYMSKLRDPAVLRFCAIPQIMAMATLQLCYDNHNVFTGGWAGGWVPLLCAWRAAAAAVWGICRHGWCAVLFDEAAFGCAISTFQAV